MAEGESGSQGCVDNRDVIVRLTGQQTNQAIYLVSSCMLTLDRWLRHLANPIRRIFSVTIKGFLHGTVSISLSLSKNVSNKKSNKQLLGTNTTIYGVLSAIFFFELPALQT